MTKSTHEQGIQKMKEILGEKTGQRIEAFDKISPDFKNYIIDFAYGDLYARKGLSDKSRELAAVASLITQGSTGNALKAHLRGMLNVGWNKNEIIELLIFLIGFVGFPKVVDAMYVLAELETN